MGNAVSQRTFTYADIVDAKARLKATATSRFDGERFVCFLSPQEASRMARWERLSGYMKDTKHPRAFIRALVAHEPAKLSELATLAYKARRRPLRVQRFVDRMLRNGELEWTTVTEKFGTFKALRLKGEQCPAR